MFPRLPFLLAATIVALAPAARAQSAPAAWAEDAELPDVRAADYADLIRMFSRGFFRRDDLSHQPALGRAEHARPAFALLARPWRITVWAVFPKPKPTCCAPAKSACARLRANTASPQLLASIERKTALLPPHSEEIRDDDDRVRFSVALDGRVQRQLRGIGGGARNCCRAPTKSTATCSAPMSRRTSVMVFDTNDRFSAYYQEQSGGKSWAVGCGR